MKIALSLFIVVLVITALVVSSFLKRLQDIHSVCRAGWIDSVKRLVNQNPECVHARNAAGETPVHQAAKYNEAEILTLLLESGGDFDARCSNSASPLHYAASFGCTEAVQVLVKAGADATATAPFPEGQFNAYDLASTGGHEDTMKYLESLGIGHTAGFTMATGQSGAQNP